MQYRFVSALVVQQPSGGTAPHPSEIRGLRLALSLIRIQIEAQKHRHTKVQPGLATWLNFAHHVTSGIKNNNF